MLSASPAWDTGFANGVTNLNTESNSGCSERQQRYALFEIAEVAGRSMARTLEIRREQTLHALTWARVAGLSTRPRPCQPRGSTTLGAARCSAQAL
jgi:hypothetical protein